MLESIKEEIHKLKVDKLVLITCLIIPICVNLIVGWQLGKGVIDHIPMAVVDYDNSQLSRQIINYFETNDAFDLQYYVDDQTQLQNLLDTSTVRVGMVIPKNFSEDVVSLRAPNILMLYDGSHMSMTSITKAKASEILLTARVGASIKHIQTRLNKSYDEAYTMAMPISFETRTLYNPTKNFNYFMTPGYGTIICQLGIALMAVVCVNFPRDEEKRRSMLGYTMGKVIFYGLLGSISILFNLLVQIYFFKIPFKGSLLLAGGLSVLFVFAVASLAVAVSAWLHNRVLAMAIIGLLLIPNSIMAGYTWPVISMLPSYQWMAKLIPFSHYGDNIRDLFLKGTTVDVFADIRFLSAFIIIMIIASILGIQIEQLRKPREADQR